MVEACNRHYLTTTGQTLPQLIKVQSTACSQNSLPGVQGGVAPYLMSVVQRRDACEELLYSIHPPASLSGDRVKVHTDEM